jgi:hypothetical protein
VDAPGKLARMTAFRYAGSRYGSLGGDAAIASGTLTGTTGGYLLAEAPMPGVDNLAGAIRVTLPATPVSRGLMQLKATGDSNNRVDVGINGTGKLSLVAYDSAANAATAITYTPDADQLAGTHTFAWRIASNAGYLYVDGAQVATGALDYAGGSRSTTDALATLIGGDGTNNLEVAGSASSWGLFTGAAAPPMLPLPLHADGTGVLDDFALTPASSATLRNGGDASAAAADIIGLPVRDRVEPGLTPGYAIGAFAYHRAVVASCRLDSAAEGASSLHGSGVTVING